MNIITANARFNTMVDSWSKSNRPISTTLPTMILEGNVGEDELSSQSTYEVA